MQQANAPNPFGLLIVIVLAVIAISGSERKWRTVLFIFGWTAVGFAVGTGIGFALGNPGTAGTLAGLMIVLMGGGTSIKQILDNRKAKAHFRR